MDDPRAVQAAHEAWEAAGEALDADRYDASTLAILAEADSLFARLDAQEWGARRAFVLEGMALCHVHGDDGAGAVRAAEEVLSGSWPEEALAHRLSTVRIAAGSYALPQPDAADLAARAVEVAAGNCDDDVRRELVELLKLHALLLTDQSPREARALLTRAVEEFSDVDDPADSAEDRLADPYLLGCELRDQPGQLAASADAFRRSAESGDEFAWLPLGVVLSQLAGREDDEEHALRFALDVESDPERRAAAGYFLGCLLHFGRGDRTGAREAFGRAVTGSGPYATMAVRELVNLAVLDGDHEARRALVAETAGRVLEEFDPDARRKDHAVIVAASRIGYSRPFIALRARQWRRQRRRRADG